MNRWISALILLPAIPGALCAQDARDIQAGDRTILQQCEALEQRVAGQWGALEQLLVGWIAEDQPDLPASWSGLLTNLANLQQESDLRHSLTGSDFSRDLLVLRARITDLTSKVPSMPAESRQPAGEKLRQVAARVDVLGKELEALGETCGWLLANLEKWKVEFEVNIQLYGAGKAREGLRKRAGTALDEIREARGGPGGAASPERSGSGAMGRAVRAPVPLPILVERARRATREEPFVNALGLEFLPLPGHPGLLMCRTETRVRDFERFVAATSYDATEGACTLEEGGWKRAGGTWRNPRFAWEEGEGADHPAVCVSWEDAKAFCTWLYQGEGLRYRLPLDAEWSAAAGPAKYPWGETFPPPAGAGNYAGEEALTGVFAANRYGVLNGYRDAAPRTAPVASQEPNELGFYDLGGNVWEWCEDWFLLTMNDPDIQKEYRQAGFGDGGGESFRVLRGGSWFDEAETSLRSSCRDFGAPGYRCDTRGFRLVLDVREGS